MKLVICEKPSVAKAVASALGVTSRADGYFEGCGSPVATSECRRHSEALTEPTGETGYIISWCVGSYPAASIGDTRCPTHQEMAV